MLNASLNPTSRPSRNKCALIRIPFLRKNLIAQKKCSISECTPPLEKSPIRWHVVIRDMNSNNFGSVSKFPDFIASVIIGNFCLNICPEPIVRCPTSELPNCPSGSPTLLPEASRKTVLGDCTSSVIYLASNVAFPTADLVYPKPSNMHNKTLRITFILSALCNNYTTNFQRTLLPVAQITCLPYFLEHSIV